MKTVWISGTDIQTSRIGFGTASLHHLLSKNKRLSLLGAAAGSGMTHFDTSPYYGNGLAEKDIGHFVRGRRDQYTITTKIGLYPWLYHDTNAASVWARKAVGKVIPKLTLPVVNWMVDAARKSLDGSLGRLGTMYVDFLLLHEPDLDLINQEEFLKWLEKERFDGRIRAWGVAGEPYRVEPFVRSDNPLAKVVQTRDSIKHHQADFMSSCDRNLQFTYGYLSGCGDLNNIDSLYLLSNALKRNLTGSVLMSTRRINHIKLVTQVSA